VSFEIASFLRERRDDIMREWEARVASEARDIKLADSALRNHLPDFLAELADWLEQGEAPGTSRMRTAAAMHAAQRLDHSFQLTQLVHEYRLLRTAILHLLLDTEFADEKRAGSGGMAERVVVLARLNAGLDFAITDGVESFVEERERRFGEATDQATRWREMDGRKNDFLAILSHELRNPLTPIHNSLFLLVHAAPGSEQANRARDVLQRQTEHLTRLIDQLLDVTRISHGKVELHRKILDARDVVRTTCDDHRSLFEQEQIDLRVEDSVLPVWTSADPTRLSQVIANLLDNAAKFTPRGGTVFVSVGMANAEVEIRVRDTGVGMEAHQLERAFEPFAQVESTLARTKGGLGLGLAMTKGVVEMHGGRVVARSEGLGFGCEIVVTLPRSEPPAERPEKASIVTAPGSLVLLIEDNVDAAKTLAEILEMSGHRVHLAHDGATGIRLARELKPHAVLCDIGLPDVDGYEVAQMLRADESLRWTKLIALTGYAHSSDKQKAEEAGFDAHLTKPPDLGRLNVLLTRRGP
jgi:signal transduction histidine kinase